MSHPIIDASSVPMEVHSAEVRRARTKLHRDRPTEDPAGAPSGLRWRLVSGGWWALFRRDSCVGTVDRLFADWPWDAGLASSSGWRRVRSGTLSDCARALVAEVRRG